MSFSNAFPGPGLETATYRVGERTVDRPMNAAEYKAYAQPEGQPGAKGAGWWVGCLILTRYGGDDQVASRLMYRGPAAYIENW